ncbi:hypothetical protein PVK06_020141 [Gossypium arboreum]|uniref:Uncharacterized protein n=1 Tax=Gossypium arboreum TaxID=29729 RepID=A0ABR0PLM0_GOSAR|nr:hypothetical protein PVK06_020141 [Gossypium arboreum]
MLGDSRNEVNQSIHNSGQSTENEIRFESVTLSVDSARAQQPKVDRDGSEGQGVMVFQYPEVMQERENNQWHNNQ